MLNNKHNQKYMFWAMVLFSILIILGSTICFNIKPSLTANAQQVRIKRSRNYSQYQRQRLENIHYYQTKIKHERRLLHYFNARLRFYQKHSFITYSHRNKKNHRVKRNSWNRHHLPSISHMSYSQYRWEIRRLTRYYSHLEHQVRNETFWDINCDRLRHHLPKLTVSYNTQYIANSRAPQVNYIYNVNHEKSDFQVHRIREGEAQVIRDAKKYHLLDPANYGENCAQISLGHYYYYNPGFKNYYYDANDGKNMADAVNKVFMDYDQSHHDGHRANILDPSFRHVGIAVIYHAHTNRGCVVEDFY